MFFFHFLDMFFHGVIYMSSDIINILHLEDIKPLSIFTYLILFTSIIAYVKYNKISFGYVFGVVLAIIIIYLLIIHEKTEVAGDKQLHELKNSYIEPKTININKYEDLTDFVFSVQDFYHYNPPSFIEMITSIDTFLEIYEEVNIDNSLAGSLFVNANEQRLNALNSLHSFIITIPSDKNIIDKLNKSTKTLEQMLNIYLTKIYDINKKYIEKNGVFNDTVHIDLNIAPYNQYSAERHGQFY